MIKKNLFKTIIFTFIVFISCQGSNDTINITTPTIQCGMCKETIESGLKKSPGIKSANVDMKNKTASVTYNINKIDIPKIEKIISELGYVANLTPANSEVYEKLPFCCKVPEPS